MFNMDTPTRKRDFDLLRLILLEIESFLPTSYMKSYIGSENFNLEKDYHSAVVFNHIEILIQAGFITGMTNHRDYSSSLKKFLWKGYEFLDNAKNESVWKSFKAEASKLGSSMSMAVANALLISLAKAQFGL